MAYAAPVFAQGDARPERQSSWPHAVRYARFAFASFVFGHLTLEAYRAGGDGAMPKAGFEHERWFMASVLLVVWLPFTWFAAREILSAPSKIRTASSAQARALAWLDPGALLFVLLFALAHGLEFAGASFRGTLSAEDVRSELIRSLSTTQSGFPLAAAIMLCGVGAACFCAVRQTRAGSPNASRAVLRALVALGIAACLLGSYAVIRCASGTLLDWP